MVNASQDVLMVHESPGTAVVDSDNAVEMVTAGKSIKITIEKALTAGTGYLAK